ncbi:MAG: DUF4307 domain-containing protein [Nocardioides sp.]
MSDPDYQATLQDRYGRKRPGHRRSQQAVLGLLITGFGTWVGWAAWFHATPRIDSDLISFTVTGEHEAVARFGVRRAEESVVGTCAIRAFAADHTTVGELTFLVPDGAAPLEQTLVQSLRTERRATSVELLGCTAPGQPRPR